jgi:tellurite resistance protein TerA
MAIELKKGNKINLTKKTNIALGEITVNLNWRSGGAKKGFFAKLFGGDRGIDLDLGCLYEMKDGRKGVVQALGKAFGDYAGFPYVALDGDDRTGAAAGGENLRINGALVAQFKRILIFTFIYEGAANWREADGVVTLKYPGQEDIVARLDEYGSAQTMCAIALLENRGDETFSVEKIVKFFDGHQFMDAAFNWGIRWTAGRK